MKFKTYLFDFDGTLVDSMPTFTSTMLKILKENNIPYEDDIVKVITPLGYKGTAEYFIRLGLKMPVDKIISIMNTYSLYEYENSVKAKRNVPEVLKTLRENGADLNVLTASPHLLLDVCLKRLGLYDIFTNVWSCDDFNTTKADPEIYKSVAERLGKPIDRILFLDDNYNANKVAKSSGIKTCGVYDDSSKEYVNDIKRVSDYYIYDFSELIV